MQQVCEQQLKRVLERSDSSYHVLVNTSKLYIPENHRRFQVLNIRRGLHTVIACFLNHGVLYAKATNPLLMDLNILCTTYLLLNTRCSIGGFRKEKGKSVDNCYISPPNFGALTPPMDGKYNFNHFITQY